MDENQGKQKINCAVTSCKFNDMHEQECELNSIVVKPCRDCCNGKAEDESMCGNYQCRN